MMAVIALFCPPPPCLAQHGSFSGSMSDAERRETSLAIEAFHMLGWDSRSVTCVEVDYQPERRRGRAGAEFDWTPWAFSAHLDQKSMAWNPLLLRQFGLLEKHGYLERIEGTNGMPTFRMTWNGYARSDGQGCFRIASDERAVTVHGKAPPPRPGAQGVSATVMPVLVEPIARDPEFRPLFGAAAENVQAFSQPAT